VRVTVHNTLSHALTFYLPTSPSANDSVVIAAGETGALSVRARTPGNFIYRGIAQRDSVATFIQVSGALAGAMVVDTAGAPRVPHDRVMVMMMTPDSALLANVAIVDIRQMAFTINGRSWPNTERLKATVGDTLHWRVINATFDVHPMHMHGFYYRVDELTGPLVARQGQGEPGRMVVTERMSPFSAMSMTWVPERAGNWLLHCHFSLHLEPPDLPGTTGRMKPDMQMNHALTGMVGLVMGINVASRGGTVSQAAATPARRLRLIATSDGGFPDSQPSYRFTIEEKGHRTSARPGMSPVLYLTRGEPVAITVVNQLSEATGVHWHGMELESYYDGVAGLSGSPTHLAPMIAPGDSFVARFTPPRAGTFMYHSHVDDIRQQAAGLVGPMIVRDGPPVSLPDDYEFMLKGARDGELRNNALELNGQPNPDTIVAHAGHPLRLRLMSLATAHVNPAVQLTARPDSAAVLPRDSMLVRWTPVAKDGMDLPVSARSARVARQLISMGETYDFEFTPDHRGQVLRVEVRGAGSGKLLVRVPIRVEQ
jgi:manganese oxidase